MEKKKTHFIYKVVRYIVKKTTPSYELSGTENLPGEPCIIAGNHCQAFGPIAAELYLPGDIATWCAGQMMHKEEVAAYAYQDFWSGKPANVRWIYKLFSHMIAPLCEIVFNDARTIGVYRDYRLKTTYKESISQLQQGANIVIFPECCDEHNNIVHEFQSKFIDLALFYYKKTQKELCFVPMYVAPYLNKICFGKPIRFNAETPIAEERERICRELMDSITEIAVSLPLHTVVPYPNISKKFYPKNLPLEVYND